MYLADCHTHSRVSPDAADSMTAMAEAAIAAGLEELCFTDHMEPIAWASTALRESYDWAALEEEFAAAQEAAEKLLESAPPLDFIIGSIHMLSERYNGLDLFYFDPKTEEEAYAGMADYLGQVKRITEWGRFDVLGHLTLPLRYFNERRGWNLTMDRFGGEITDIFATLNRQGIGIELNTNRGNTPLPDAKWLKMYRDLGGEIITLGSDAHRRRDVGCAIRERQELLRACGFTRFCTFTRMEPVWHPL